MILTRKQTRDTVATEAMYQLEVKGQYLNKDDSKFYLTMLVKYASSEDFEDFLDTHPGLRNIL